MRMMAMVLSGALALTPVLGACGDDPGPTGTEDPDPRAELVTTIRNATGEFTDLAAATIAGYEVASPCVDGPDGGMGFHYLSVELADATIEAGEPEMLLYAPTAAGPLELVGVEYLVPSAAWEAAGHNGTPRLAGQSFADHRAEADRHGIPFPHYDLHVWAWSENEAGLFHPFNPAVSCDP